MKRLALLGSLALSAACQPDEPGQFSLTPGITVFESDPGQKPPLPGQPPRSVPDGMVYVPGGYTQIGSEDGLDQEKPTFWVLVKPFLMDQHEVTVGQFQAFVKATGFKTQAEVFGDAGVFNDSTKGWDLIKGANWQHPYGPQAGTAPDNMPVTQVSWNDAQAYAKWAGKRLPHEIEWEHAARNARNSRSLYPFGDSLTGKGRPLANTWNGKFPDFDQVSDGFHQAAPVGTFGPSPLGLSDMAGNVWEWCEDPKVSYTDLLKRGTGGSYTARPLPVAAQTSPVFTLTSLDYNKDGQKDLLLCGNTYQTRLRFGRSDANRGLLLRGDGKGNFMAVPQAESGFDLRGDVRSVMAVGNQLLIGINQQPVRVYGQ